MNNSFNEEECLHKIKHYLPAQAPLKDFVHHNTLHAFQELPFFEALQLSNQIFGYKTSLSLNEYRELYNSGKISEAVLDQFIESSDLSNDKLDLKKRILEQEESNDYTKRIGRLRNAWKTGLNIDLNTLVHLNLFKFVGSYLDQGISAKPFPNSKKGLLHAIAFMQSQTLFNLFHSARVTELLNSESPSIKVLLKILVGEERFFEQYLFDQQFAHPGWSGIVATIEKSPKTLFSHKEVTLYDFIYLELLFEIDALDSAFGSGNWNPIASYTQDEPINITGKVKLTDTWGLKQIWQQSLEFTHYNKVLKGLRKGDIVKEESATPSFQALFCIDDREESIRRNIEMLDPNCETYGTPAHFNLPIYYRPAGGKFNTQVCPGPINPQHIILDDSAKEKKQIDVHFHQSSHHWFSGWMIAQTVGFWSAMKLFLNIFKPTVSPGHSSSLEHMSHKSNLIIENVNGEEFESLKVGFTIDEMCDMVYAELKKIGLINNFSPIVYLFGHGGSSTNNPYYAGYNCGACSGRPSSLNARVFASMANRKEVREFLSHNGIEVPNATQFVGGLHDTTRDEFTYYDLEILSKVQLEIHEQNKLVLNKALANNAKERARLFNSVDLTKSAEAVHKEVKKRSVALFEPIPELNHTNNCLCIVGGRDMSINVDLDQRSFLNSYDWKIDTDGELLKGILGAATPVCGGINLEYYFSRVDNENFGAGSKLSHNVVGLFGVANGIEGDLRTGLPSQMINQHDPLRLMMIVEQKPEVVLNVINSNSATLEWYKNQWLNLVVIDPESNEMFIYINGYFEKYLVSELIENDELVSMSKLILA